MAVLGKQSSFEIVTGIIDIRAMADTVATDADGAIATFSGIVRGTNRGKKVLFLEYEAYPEMAIKMLERIGAEVAENWGLERLKIQHRVGRLNVGETSVAVVVASPHRADSFAACQYAIDRLKRIVPIWKKEVFEDGEVWVEGPSEKVEVGNP